MKSQRHHLGLSISAFLDQNVQRIGEVLQKVAWAGESWGVDKLVVVAYVMSGWTAGVTHSQGYVES